MKTTPLHDSGNSKFLELGLSKVLKDSLHKEKERDSEENRCPIASPAEEDDRGE